MTWTEL